MIPFQEENMTNFQCHRVSNWQLCIRKLFFSIEAAQNAIETKVVSGTSQGVTGI